ncbi:hypothetical protein GCM10029963_43390 [Micromonospora andamanensis]
MLAEADLDELLNEALLLTTELSTNAVEHARTELDIEVTADQAGLTVTVSDFAAGPVDELTVGVRNLATEITEVAERGAGCCSSTTSPAGGAPRTCVPARVCGSGWTAPTARERGRRRPRHRRAPAFRTNPGKPPCRVPAR